MKSPNPMLHIQRQEISPPVCRIQRNHNPVPIIPKRRIVRVQYRRPLSYTRHFHKKNPYPYLLKSDCFLMCSRYEPFGLVILESLTLKVPVLSLEELSIHEIMNKKYGIIVENSSKGLYNGILDIIENKNKLQELRSNLENYSYNINDIIKKIEDLLDE